MKDQFREYSVEDLYPVIGRSLLRCLPEGWQEARLSYEWPDADVTRLRAFVTDRSGEERSISVRPAGPELSDALMELARKMDEAGHPRWQKATFTLDRSGRFTLDYDYPPEGEPPPARLWDYETYE